MLDQSFIQAMAERLRQERLAILADIEEIKKPELPVDNPDEGDLAEDSVEDILQGSSLTVLKNLLEKIDRALAKIKDGTYGRCEATGREIPREVLTEEPWIEVLPPVMRHQAE